jgi:hypothetical protein
MATRKKPDLAATIADAGWKIEAQWLPMQNLTSALPSGAILIARVSSGGHFGNGVGAPVRQGYHVPGRRLD